MRMPMRRVLVVLALVAAACTILLVVVAGPMAQPIPGYPYNAARQIGREVGGWFFMFLFSSIGASVAAFVNRNRSDISYPGLTTGIVLALIVTALNMMGRSTQ